jgi:hypothetical protein
MGGLYDGMEMEYMDGWIIWWNAGEYVTTYDEYDSNYEWGMTNAQAETLQWENLKLGMRPRLRWDDNIKMNLREIEYEAMEWIELAQGRYTVVGLCETSVSIKAMEEMPSRLLPRYTLWWGVLASNLVPNTGCNNWHVCGSCVPKKILRHYLKHTYRSLPSTPFSVGNS